jgi:hypothetical protein
VKEAGVENGQRNARQRKPSNYESNTSQDDTIETSGRIQHSCSFPRVSRVENAV